MALPEGTTVGTANGGRSAATACYAGRIHKLSATGHSEEEVTWDTPLFLKRPSLRKSS